MVYCYYISCSILLMCIAISLDNIKNARMIAKRAEELTVLQNALIAYIGIRTDIMQDMAKDTRYLNALKNTCAAKNTKK